MTIVRNGSTSPCWRSRSSPRSPAGGPARWAPCCPSSAWCSAPSPGCCSPRTSSATSTRPRTKLFATLFLILALVVIGEIAGVVLGRAVRGAIRNRGLRTVDSMIGVALQLVVVLVAAWLLATPLTSSDQPNLAAAVRGSKVLAQVDKYAPDLAEVGAQADVGPAGHLGPARRAAAVRPHPDRRRSTPPTPRWPTSLVVANARPERGEDPRRGTGLPEGPGGNRFRRRAQPGDVQRARGRGLGQRHRRGRRPDATTPPSSPTTPTPTSRSSTCPNLPQRRCVFAEQPAKSGTDAVVLGYPGGGDFAATPARVREIIELNGPDIYRTTTVDREVYTIRGTVRQGNSGGPMINRAGQVLGVVFGAAVDDDDTGFVLTANEVSRQLAKIGNTEQVPTGACVTLSRRPYTWSEEPRDRWSLTASGASSCAKWPRRRRRRTGRAARNAGCGSPGRRARTGRRRHADAASERRAAGSSTA